MCSRLGCECSNRPYLLVIHLCIDGYKLERGLRFVGSTPSSKAVSFAHGDRRLDLSRSSLFQPASLEHQGWMKLVQNKEVPCMGNYGVLLRVKFSNSF